MNPKEALAKEIARVSHLKGDFRLRSGAVSNEYFDKYRFEADPAILREVAVQLSLRLPDNYDILAGLEMGGIPLATMVAQVTGKPSLFIRKKAKDYGTCRFAEGGEVKGKQLVVIEDVVTSGGQIIESVRALRGEGAIISDVICVIDREAGGRENLAKEDLTLTSVFLKDDLIH